MESKQEIVYRKEEIKKTAEANKRKTSDQGTERQERKHTEND